MIRFKRQGNASASSIHGPIANVFDLQRKKTTAGETTKHRLKYVAANQPVVRSLADRGHAVPDAS